MTTPGLNPPLIPEWLALLTVVSALAGVVVISKVRGKLIRILLASVLLGCLITIYSSRLFVIQTENVHKQLITYEKGFPFPYIIETARVNRETLQWRVRWDPALFGYYTYIVGYEILAIPLLSSIISNTFAVAGIIGIIVIGEKKSSLRGYRLRDQLGTKVITQFRSVKGEGTDS
jgi:hypothetical protein